jgi:hypothetical protein
LKVQVVELEDQLAVSAVSALSLSWYSVTPMRTGPSLPRQRQHPKGREPGDPLRHRVLFDRLPEPIDLELDLTNRVLYWTGRGDPPRGNTVNRMPIVTPRPSAKDFEKNGRSGIRPGWSPVPASRFLGNEVASINLPAEAEQLHLSSIPCGSGMENGKT